MADDPTCPRCQETRMIDAMQQDWKFCNVCACPFRWPRPADESHGAVSEGEARHLRPSRWELPPRGNRWDAQ